MNYRDTMKSVDTMKALIVLGLEGKSQGAYIYFDCPNCQKKAGIKAYGDKKNLYYCPSCKSSGHIISLTMKIKGIEWEKASEFLSTILTEIANKITEELNLNYELIYNDFIKSKGISQGICFLLDIGVPKGKTMLSGCVAFAIKDEGGKKIAYYGIRMKDGNAVFHKSFNPELYLYGYDVVDIHQITYFTTDIFKCVKYLEDKKQCVCNFGLPYLSSVQIDLLGEIEKLVFMVDEKAINTIAIQLAQSQKGFYRFDH